MLPELSSCPARKLHAATPNAWLANIRLLIAVRSASGTISTVIPSTATSLKVTQTLSTKQNAVSTAISPAPGAVSAIASRATTMRACASSIQPRRLPIGLKVKRSITRPFNNLVDHGSIAIPTKLPIAIGEAPLSASQPGRATSTKPSGTPCRK